MRKMILGLTGLALFAVGSCGATTTTSVEPTTGPAVIEPSASSPSPSPTSTAEPTAAPSEEMSIEEVQQIVCPTLDRDSQEYKDYRCEVLELGDEEDPSVATFKDGYNYEDGVKVEVTQIQHGKVTAYQSEIDEGLRKGQDWVMFTVRVKNGSKRRLDASGSTTLTYGPDGDRADSPYLADGPRETSLTGKILPGRSKSWNEVYVLPSKYQNDPVLEDEPDHGDRAGAGRTFPAKPMADLVAAGTWARSVYARPSCLSASRNSSRCSVDKRPSAMSPRTAERTART